MQMDVLVFVFAVGNIFVTEGNILKLSFLPFQFFMGWEILWGIIEREGGLRLADIDFNPGEQNFNPSLPLKSSFSLN